MSSHFNPTSILDFIPFGPDDDAELLRQAGVSRVYTPKDFDLTRIMSDIVEVVEESASAA